MQAPSTWNYNRIAEVFRERGLPVPDAKSCDPLISAANSLSSQWSLYHGHGALTGSSEWAKRIGCRPADLAFSLLVVTLENRTLSPVVEHFIENCRAEAKLMGGTVIGKA